MNPELFTEMPEMPEYDLFPDLPDWDDLEEEFLDDLPWEDDYEGE